ncbi:hypothetical protein H2200_008724 [Cladophialophora chaetospira]|uniref:AB hydrolase-1 domain-containing protein n=1 Tax=Cladophialophora chaetospira TaxID=386627 RepID=A0AA39CFU0_9EURO|nr:hypothetical protein H2200_008724 [Cladophialophora chaetospira]
MASESNTKILSRDISLPSAHPSTGQETKDSQQRQPTSLNIRYHKPSTPDFSAPTILFLPFWGGSASTFEAVQLELSKRAPYHTSIAVSYPGTGSSRQEGISLATSPVDHDPPEDHDIPALAAHVAALLKDLGHGTDELSLIPSRKIVIYAHSMSAKVTWEVLRTLKSFNTLTVTGLLLLAPAPPGPLVLPTEMREQQLKAYDSLESATWTLKNMLTHKILDDEVIGKLARDCVGMNSGAKRGWIELGMKRDCLAAVEELATQLGAQVKQKGFEVKVLAGQEDKVETVERVKNDTVDVLGRLGFAVNFTVLPGVGHLLPIEAPEEVALALQALLSSSIGR